MKTIHYVFISMFIVVYKDCSYKPDVLNPVFLVKYKIDCGI